MVAFLVSCFKKYRATKLWKKSVLGGAFVIEVTGKKGDWHAHLHIVVESYWMDFKTHQPVWNAISKGAGWYCKVIPPAQVVRYLSKYLAKPGVEPDDLGSVNPVLRNYRLFQSFGSWYGGLADFKDPARKCPVCGGEHYAPFDILYTELLKEGIDLDRIDTS